MDMQSLYHPHSWAGSQWAAWSTASRALIFYGAAMAIALIATYVISWGDNRTYREVGIWVKPMKFMAATVLFAWTTVVLAQLASHTVSHSNTFNWIAAVLVVTSLFEVVYITHQASLGSASHYNTSDTFHALMFGIMGIAAVALTATQAWLAWEIWSEQRGNALSVLMQGIIVGLVLTFVLSTVSGFLLGGKQPPSGSGLPIFGWHLWKDIRPSHFLGVHAHQLIPLAAWLAERYLGQLAQAGFAVTTALYVIAWGLLTWTGLASG